MTMATAVFLVLLAFTFGALCHQSVQNYGLKRTLLPCQKQNVKALSNLVGNAWKAYPWKWKVYPRQATTSIWLYQFYGAEKNRLQRQRSTLRFHKVLLRWRGFTVGGKSENKSWHSRPRSKGMCFQSFKQRFSNKSQTKTLIWPYIQEGPIGFSLEVLEGVKCSWQRDPPVRMSLLYTPIWTGVETKWEISKRRVHQ